MSVLYPGHALCDYTLNFASYSTWILTSTSIDSRVRILAQPVDICVSSIGLHNSFKAG